MAAYPSHPLPRTDLTAHSTLLTNASSAHPAHASMSRGASPDNRYLPASGRTLALSPPSKALAVMETMGMLSVPLIPPWHGCPRWPLQSVSIRGMRISTRAQPKISGPLWTYTDPQPPGRHCCSTSMPRISRRVLAILTVQLVVSCQQATRQPEKSSRSLFSTLFF